MRTITLFALIALAVADTNYYKIADEHFNIEALIANRLELQAFLDCFQDKGPCKEITTTYKQSIRDAVATACTRCSPNHRFLFWRFLQGVKAYSPKEYWNFRHYFDPENKYFDALEKVISKYVKPDMELIL